MDSVLLILLFIALTSFLYYESTAHSNEIIIYLYKIFIPYTVLYLFLRMFFYGYKIMFQLTESYFIDIKDLKVGDIVSKQYLIRMF